MNLLFVLRDKQTQNIEFEAEVESFEDVEPRISKYLNLMGVNDALNAVEELKKKTGDWVQLINNECFLMDYDQEQANSMNYDLYELNTSIK